MNHFGYFSMRRKLVGLTLIEVLMVMVIIAVLLAVALPTFYNLRTKARLISEMNSVMSSLNFARSEATKRGQPVSVCAPDGAAMPNTNCDPASTDWSAGWIVVSNTTFSTTDANNPRKVLAQSQGVSQSDTLTVSTGGAIYPTFTPAGYTFWTGQLKLWDAKNTTGMDQYICIKSGSVTKLLYGTAGPCP